MKVGIFTKDNSNSAGLLFAKAFLESHHDTIVIGKKTEKNELLKIPLLKVYDIEDHNGKECEELLEKENVDVIIIADDVILKPSIYSKAKLALNYHPGILPWYRGSHCIFHAIRNKEFDKIGYTIHKVGEKVDTGEIVYKKVMPLLYEDTAEKIISRCEEEAARKMRDLVNVFSLGGLTSVEQDLSLGSLFKGEPTEEEKKQYLEVLNSLITVAQDPQDAP